MGDIHGMEKIVTLAELAEISGGNYDTFYRKARRKFPEIQWTKDSIVSADQVAVLSGKVPQLKAKRSALAVVREVRTVAPEVPANRPVVKQPTPARATWQTLTLYGILIAATAASVQNMYRVTSELSEARMSALLLTIVLSASAIGLVLAKARRVWSYVVVFVLVAYESICNMTRIHAGLYSNTGNPTRFLSQFCDTYDSGTHESAFFLALSTALFIAVVQYAAVFEINRK